MTLDSFKAEDSAIAQFGIKQNFPWANVFTWLFTSLSLVLGMWCVCDEPIKDIGSFFGRGFAIWMAGSVQGRCTP